MGPAACSSKRSPIKSALPFVHASNRFRKSEIILVQSEIILVHLSPKLVWVSFLVRGIRKSWSRSPEMKSGTCFWPSKNNGKFLKWSVWDEIWYEYVFGDGKHENDDLETRKLFGAAIVSRSRLGRATFAGGTSAGAAFSESLRKHVYMFTYMFT